MSTPSTIQDFEDMLSILDLKSEFVGNYFLTYCGKICKIIGLQKRWVKGYLYSIGSGNTYVMPSQNIIKISNLFEIKQHKKKGN